MRVRDAIAAAMAALAFAALAAGEDDEDAPAPTGPITRVVTVLRGENREPIAGATVDAVGLPGGTVTKSTGKDGVVRFTGVPRRGVTFVARCDGRFPAWHEPGGFSWATREEDEDNDGDGVTSMTFGLAKGSVFEGRVLAKDDGAPIAGATVTAQQEADATDQFELDAAPTWTAVTDAEGRFRTDSHIPEGFPTPSLHLRITARAPGWISEHVDARPHRERSAKFELLRAGRLRGVVKDGDGKTVAGALVHAYPPDCGVFHRGAPEEARDDEDAHPRVLETVTDAQGRYEMPELHPGVKFFVYAERKEQAPEKEFEWMVAVSRSDVAEGIGVTAAGEEAVCDLTLHALSTLVVCVASDAGGDAESVDCELSSGPPHSYPWIDGEQIHRGRKFMRLDPGTYRLRVDARGWLPLERSVDVPAGGRTELTVRLSRGAAIEGVVVDDQGTPAAGVEVIAYAIDPATGRMQTRNSAWGRTDAAGAFRFTGLPPGPLDVTARDDDHVPGDYLRVTAPSSDVRLVVVRQPFISLRVDAPPGDSLPGKLRVRVRDLAGRYAGLRDGRSVRTADLPAKLDRVRPGPADVTVDVPGFAPATIHVELKPGETTPVGPFEFREGVTLTGRVIDASGRPVAGARVTPYENDARTAATGDDGTFALPHLAPGATEIRVVATEFPETRLVAAAPSEGAATVVVLRPGGIVRGTARARDGTSVARRLLCIFDVTDADGYGPHWEARPGKEGDFSLRLPAGKYRWVPSRYEFDQGAVVFEVTEGGTTDVAFELP